MLTDADRLLVAAATDGPLTPTDAERLGRLLVASPAARFFADQLAGDRRRLGELPHFVTPLGFAEDVLGALPIIVPARPVERPRRSAWLPVATAAGVLAAVGVLTFQLAGPRRQPQVQQGVARATPARPTTPPASRVEVAPEPQPAPEPGPVVAIAPAPTPETEVAPPPRSADGPELFAAGLFTGIEPPAEVLARLPLLGPLADLDTPAGRAQATAAWATFSAARLDLFVADPAAAVPVVQEAAKSCGWAVVVDQAAQALVRARHPGTFAVYVDGLTAADGSTFLAALAAQQKGGAKLGPAHMSAFGATETKEVRDLLGEPKRAARVPNDSSTIGQVVKQLAPRHPALLFALSPAGGRPGPASKEVRAFADGRGERLAGAIPLLLVVRAHEAN